MPAKGRSELATVADPTTPVGTVARAEFDEDTRLLEQARVGEHARGKPDALAVA